MDIVLETNFTNHVQLKKVMCLPKNRDPCQKLVDQHDPKNFNNKRTFGTKQNLIMFFSNMSESIETKLM